VYVAALRRADHPSKESYQLSISVRLRNLIRGGLGPTKLAGAPLNNNNNKRRWENNIKIVIKEMWYENIDWIQLTQEKIHWRAFLDLTTSINQSFLHSLIYSLHESDSFLPVVTICTSNIISLFNDAVSNSDSIALLCWIIAN
jgi:hypothetical protein